MPVRPDQVPQGDLSRGIGEAQLSLGLSLMPHWAVLGPGAVMGIGRGLILGTQDNLSKTTMKCRGGDVQLCLCRHPKVPLRTLVSFTQSFECKQP